jgi:hypothetical protein
MSGDRAVLADLVVAFGVILILVLLVLSRMRQAWRLTRYADSSPRAPSDAAAGRTSGTPVPPDGPGGRPSPAGRD